MSVYPLLSTEEEGWQGASVPAPSGLFGELMTLIGRMTPVGLFRSRDFERLLQLIHSQSAVMWRAELLGGTHI